MSQELLELVAAIAVGGVATDVAEAFFFAVVQNLPIAEDWIVQVPDVAGVKSGSSMNR